MKKLLISIIIPIKKISNYLRDENLPAFVTQTYKNFEVILLPNKSSEEDKKLLLNYKWLKIIPTDKVTRPAEKRDIGVKNAKGSIVAFIDDDAFPTPNWLEQAGHYFELKKTEVICGPGIIPQKTNLWEKIFNEILISPIGSGGYQYRFVQKNSRFVDDYPSMNFLIQKNIFQKLGGFNSEYWPGEDSKLCEDLVYKYKGRIYYNPAILVYHHRRNNLIGFLKQHAGYGFHRGAFFAHGDRNSKRLSYLIPTFFVFYIIFLSLFPNPYFLIPLMLYIFLGLFLIVQSFVHTKNIILSVSTFFVLFLTHFTYGIMFVRGFIIGTIKNKKIY